MLNICALIHEYTHHPQFANDSKELSMIKQLNACALSPYLSLTLSLSPPLQFDQEIMSGSAWPLPGETRTRNAFTNTHCESECYLSVHAWRITKIPVAAVAVVAAAAAGQIIAAPLAAAAAAQCRTKVCNCL